MIETIEAISYVLRATSYSQIRGELAPEIKIVNTCWDGFEFTLGGNEIGWRTEIFLGYSIFDDNELTSYILSELRSLECVELRKQSFT